MKHLMLALSLVAMPCVASSVDFDFDDVVETDTEVESNPEKVLAAQEAERDLWNHLQASRADGERAQIRVTLGELDKALLDHGGDGEARGGHLLGVHMPVGQAIDLGREAMIGKVASVGTERVWTTSIQSEGATALRIHFTNVDLPKGAALYVYNDAGQAHGPYTGQGPHGDGDFWSHTVFGEHAWVQVHAPGRDRKSVRSPVNAGFEIADVSHIGSDFALAVDADKADCSANVDCVENAECYDWSELNIARRAAAFIIYEDPVDGKSYGCSGGLLNDANGAHRIPWFLTANHCISTEFSANSLEAFFQYQSDCGSCAGRSTAVDTVLGADLWAHSTYSDFALLELSRLPSAWALQGWTNANMRSKVGTQLYSISHPQGQPQAVTQLQINNTLNEQWIHADTLLGTFEGMSSGAPIFREDRKVVGTYRGSTWPGQSYDRCDYTTYDNRSGALSAFWKSVKAYLGSPTKTYPLHVSALTTSVERTGSTGFPSYDSIYKARVTATVVDQLGHGVPWADVEVGFNGVFNGTASGLTDDDGQVTVEVVFVTGASPNFSACVDDVEHPFFNTYDIGANAVTCVSP